MDECPIFFLRAPEIVIGWLVIIGLMMVSSLPTYSFKGTKLPQKLVVPIFLIGGIFIAGALTEPWIALAALIFCYLQSIPLSFRSYRKLMKLY